MITFKSAKASIASVTASYTILPGPPHRLSTTMANYETPAVVAVTVLPFSIQLLGNKLLKSCCKRSNHFLDVLGNPIKDNNVAISASTPNATLGQRTATTTNGIAQFNNLNMTQPRRGLHTIYLNTTDITTIGVTFNITITAGRPHTLEFVATPPNTTACDAQVPVPAFSVRVFDSGYGELNSFQTTLFNLASNSTTVSNTLIGTSAPFVFSTGIMQGYSGLSRFSFSVESNRTISPGPSATIQVTPGVPRNMTISPISVSVDIAGPNISLPNVTLNVRDFCGNIPNSNPIVTIRPLTSALSLFNGASSITQEVRNGSAVLSLQFASPVPGTYTVSFEMAGVNSVILSVVVIAGGQFRLSNPMFDSPSLAPPYPAIPLRTIFPSIQVLDIQGNPTPSSKISILIFVPNQFPFFDYDYLLKELM